jgi:hypothetical protein
MATTFWKIERPWSSNAFDNKYEYYVVSSFFIGIIASLQIP